MIERVTPFLSRFTVPVPWQQSGPVNVYVLHGDDPTMIDTGADFPGAREEFDRALFELDLPIVRLRHVLITHGHYDHCAGLPRIVKESQALITCPAGDLPDITNLARRVEDSGDEYDRVMREWGLDGEVTDLMNNLWEGMRDALFSIEPRNWRVLDDGDHEFTVGGRAVRALHTPGHTRGGMVYYLPEERLLFSNDVVLRRITPNPDVYVPLYRGKRTGLGDYLASLKRIRDLDVDMVLPGHGRPFGGFAQRIAGILQHHEDRASRIREALLSEPRSVAEAVAAVFGALEPMNRYLACREVHGHMDLLLEAGAVTCHADGDVRRYAPA